MPAFGNDAVRLYGDAVAENRVVQNAARTDDASARRVSFAKKLDARLQHRVFSCGNVRPDEYGFRKLNGDAGIHQFLALALAKNVIHLPQIRARVAAEHFARIRRDLRENGLTLRSEDGDCIRQVNFTMLVSGFTCARAGQSLSTEKQ